MEQKRVLIVDDDKLFRIIGTSFLNRKSFLLDFAQSGSETLEKARSGKPHLILLDYEMEDMNGCEVCEKLKRDQDTQHIPVIILSSATSDDSREKCLAAGCSAFLLKPIRREDLINVVEETLNETQRSFPRASVTFSAIVRKNDLEENAVIQSLSVAGASIIMGDRPRPGDQFEVLFASSELRLDSPILVEVVWIGRVSEKGDTGVGVKFIEMGCLEKELLTRYVLKKLHQIETCA
ncbi:MAG: response regulator [bacterium]|nr:response regulator [bacterium]